ncbi:MAG: DUF2147 domain-containing protein [Hyphomicrobiaceae bacterium]
MSNNQLSVRLTAIALGGALLSALMLTPALAADPVGVWKRPSTGTVVEFYGCGSRLCAKIVGVADASRQSTVGTVIMSGADQKGDGVWKGDLLNTEDGKTYSGVVTMIDDGHLKLEGCALLGIVCKGEVWDRQPAQQ